MKATTGEIWVWRACAFTCVWGRGSKFWKVSSLLPDTPHPHPHSVHLYSQTAPKTLMGSINAPKECRETKTQNWVLRPLRQAHWSACTERASLSEFWKEE